MWVAALQMVSTNDVTENLEAAARLLREARDKGAGVAVLPENFALFSSHRMRALAEQERDFGQGPVTGFLREQARELGLWVVAGSIPLAQRPDGRPVGQGRVRACALVVSDTGELAARYDKIHLFDAQVGDAQGEYRESDTLEPGDTLQVVDTPAGRLGLSICYDLRFAELYRGLRSQSADWVVVPAAFTHRTGEAHWEPLLRARAIENQFWVVAPNQGGWHSDKRQTWGHSMIVDPWGRVVQERIEEGEGVVIADLDRERLSEVRAAMPVWTHRRL